MNDVGKTIRQLRENKGLTQEQLADRINVSIRTIQRFERDKHSSNMKTLEKIAAALDIEPLLLLGYDVNEDEVYSKSFSSLEEAIKDEMEVRKLRNQEPAAVRLTHAFEQLNDDGQAKAVERVEELTEVPKYKKE